MYLLDLDPPDDEVSPAAAEDDEGARPETEETEFPELLAAAASGGADGPEAGEAF